LRDKDTNDMIKKMGEILKTHPFTQMIYTDNNFLKIKNASTIKELLIKVILNFDN